MTRPELFPSDAILDAALAVVAESGVGALTMTAVARRLGAPSGSLYHRFSSRAELAGRLWLRTQDRFHEVFAAGLEHPDPLTAARHAARNVVEFSHDQRLDAMLAMRYRADDLLRAQWPDDVMVLYRRQRRRMSSTITSLQRAFGLDDRESLRRITFAVIDVPYSAVRAAIVSVRLPDALVKQLIDEAVVALLEPLVVARRASAIERAEELDQQ
ncbi:MAG: TetR/AcrR family transcriptional regulator [Actinobacteria bacterium]|nr:TetR/AcrR family transcriptional regulator [Actinomycetota bacterium]